MLYIVYKYLNIYIYIYILCVYIPRAYPEHAPGIPRVYREVSVDRNTATETQTLK